MTAAPIAAAPIAAAPTTHVAAAERDGLWDAHCERCSWRNRGLKEARARNAAGRHPAACNARHA